MMSNENTIYLLAYRQYCSGPKSRHLAQADNYLETMRVQLTKSV